MTGIALAAASQSSAQSFIQPADGGQILQASDPTGWQTPAVPGSIYVSRYGYWRNQPVKMAYWSAMPRHRVPAFFHLADSSGRIVYTGHPVWMRSPAAVMVPVGVTYPGVRIYALNFSGYTEPGTYFVELPGYPASGIFRIRGVMPETAYPLPRLNTFEYDSGMQPGGNTAN